MDEETLEKLTDKLEIVRINIPYFKKLCYTKDVKNLDGTSKLIGLIEMKDKSLAESITEGDDRLKDIVKKVEKFSATDEIIGAYDLEKHRQMMAEAEKEEARREARDEGISEGINQGISQGISQEKRATAKNMLKENLDIELISKITGLSLEQIKALLND